MPAERSKRQAVRVTGPGLIMAILSAALAYALTPGCGAESESASGEPQAPAKIESAAETGKDSVEDAISWAKPINRGPDLLFSFVEAVSGKELQSSTYDLLRGVTEVTIDRQKIAFLRVDKEELCLGSNTAHGSKFFTDWEKAKINLEAKVGPPGREFLESIGSVRVCGERIEVVRNGAQDTTINLGGHKLHHAFDLRGIRFRGLSMIVDRSGKHPTLKDIQGVSAIINAPGFSFPVEVKEFAKRRLEKGNDIRVGVRNPFPAPMRAVLFLPGILRFYFLLQRQETK